jgi:hypothetical protein
VGPRAFLEATEKRYISGLCWESNPVRPSHRVVARQSELNQLDIREVPGSKLRPESDFLTEVYHGFPQSLHANVWIVPQIRP